MLWSQNLVGKKKKKSLRKSEDLNEEVGDPLLVLEKEREEEHT